MRMHCASTAVKCKLEVLALLITLAACLLILDPALTLAASPSSVTKQEGSTNTTVNSNNEGGLSQTNLLTFLIVLVIIGAYSFFRPKPRVPSEEKNSSI